MHPTPERIELATRLARHWANNPHIDHEPFAGLTLIVSTLIADDDLTFTVEDVTEAIEDPDIRNAAAHIALTLAAEQNQS